MVKEANMYKSVLQQSNLEYITAEVITTDRGDVLKVALIDGGFPRFTCPIRLMESVDVGDATEDDVVNYCVTIFLSNGDEMSYGVGDENTAEELYELISDLIIKKEKVAKK